MALFFILILFSFFCRTVHAQVEGSIRLNGRNSTRWQGRVEIFTNNTWVTVCSTYFSQLEAKVVCRQLGIISGIYLDKSVAITDGRFGPGSGQRSIEDIRCHGYEASILNCMLSYCKGLYCDHTTDVGVICIAPPQTPSPIVPPRTTIPWVPPPIATTPTYQTPPLVSGLFSHNYGKCVNSQNSIVRLVGTYDTCEDSGVVQVFIHNQWVGICDDFWERVDAQVICRMLCYDASQSLAGGEDFNTWNIPELMMVTRVTCEGYEADIRSCNYTEQINVCGRNEMAMVTCAQLTVTPTIQPPDLSCENSMITANFSSTWEGFVPHSQLTLVWHQTGLCSATKSDFDTYITFSIPFEQCGTIRTWNSTHIIYKNAILYVPAPTGIITRVKTYMIYVQCEINRQYYLEKPILPATVTAIATAPGNYTVLMHFYTDNFITVIAQYPVRIPVGNWLNVAIELITTEANLILIVTSCYATPSSNRLHPTRYSLFSDKCKDDQTVCFFNLGDLLFGFRYQTFKFVQYNEVHIHCEAYVCPKEDQSQECDRSCFRNTQGQIGKRKKREADRKLIYIKSDVILMYDPADEQGGLTYMGPTKPSYPDKFTTPAYDKPSVITPSHLSNNIIIASNEVSKSGTKESENKKQIKEPEQPNPTNSSVDAQIVLTTIKDQTTDKEKVEEQSQNGDNYAPDNTEQVGEVPDSVDIAIENKHVTATVRVKEVAGLQIERELRSTTFGATGFHTEPDHLDGTVRVKEVTEQKIEAELKSTTFGATGFLSEPDNSNGKEEQPKGSSMKPAVEVVTTASEELKLKTTKRHEKDKSEEVPEEVHEANATFERLVLVGSSDAGIQIPTFGHLLVWMMSSVILF